MEEGGRALAVDTVLLHHHPTPHPQTLAPNRYSPDRLESLSQLS